MTNNPIQIIYLNGASSSGKTTLAKALQQAFEEPFLHVGIDKIIGWMPEKINDWTGGEAPIGYSWKKSMDESSNLIQELQMGTYAQRIGRTFQEVVLALAKMGHRIIIDDVSFGKQQLDEWKKILKDFRVLWVGVNAPLAVLEQREKDRGNRIQGSARGQFHKVHADAIYDLEIDTHHLNLKDGIEKIKTFTHKEETTKMSLQVSLETCRLLLRLPNESDSIKIKAFDERNREHLSPWRSTTGETKKDHQAQIMQWNQEFKEGKSIRFLLFLKDNLQGEIIGFCNFTQIFRGPFQACYLGYHIDKDFEGKGLMSEAVGKAIEYMFEQQNLHRIMANYMPSNEKSAGLLQKLGFVVEGRAKKYLLINGQWEDHILTSKTNENWLSRADF